MEIKDMVGMMSTGALVALGIVFVMDKLDGGDTAEVAAVRMQQQEPAPFVQPVVAQAEPTEEEVTRTNVNLLGQSTAQRLERIVAVSSEGLSQTANLTPEQEEIIKFFERAARDMNQTTHNENDTAFVQFSNMAVQGLNVRYFYRVGQLFGAINKPELFAEQQAVMRNTLCNNDAIRTLLSDYGFEYKYTYISKDSRQLGSLEADADICT